jgi:hypothetical protein
MPNTGHSRQRYTPPASSDHPWPVCSPRIKTQTICHHRYRRKTMPARGRGSMEVVVGQERPGKVSRPCLAHCRLRPLPVSLKVSTGQAFPGIGKEAFAKRKQIPRLCSLQNCNILAVRHMREPPSQSPARTRACPFIQRASLADHFSLLYRYTHIPSRYCFIRHRSYPSANHRSTSSVMGSRS